MLHKQLNPDVLSWEIFNIPEICTSGVSLSYVHRVVRWIRLLTVDCFFNFLLPSEMFEIRRAKFNCKLMNCSNVLNYFGLGLIVWNVQVTDYIIIFSISKFSMLPDAVFLVNKDYHYNIHYTLSKLWLFFIYLCITTPLSNLFLVAFWHRHNKQKPYTGQELSYCILSVYITYNYVFREPAEPGCSVQYRPHYIVHVLFLRSA